MSFTLTLSGNSSELSAEYYPPLELNGNYECGLINFESYHSIPNVDFFNNMLHIGEDIIEIPLGTYELDAINKYVNDYLYNKHGNKIYKAPAVRPKIDIKANNNTLKSEVKSTHTVYFDKPNSIGSLLGFTKRTLAPNKWHFSDLPVNIMKVNVIRILTNITTGAYMNNNLVHTLHEFFPTVPSGYKINETPKNVIYLPVNVRRVTSISIKIVDQDNQLINFRGETISVRLHLRKC